MLTDDDVVKIQALKARGYSKAKVAKTMRLARGTVAKYWGARGERVSRADLKGDSTSASSGGPVLIPLAV